MTLSFASTTTPIVGVVRVAGQPDRPFTGWLGLFAALRVAVGAVNPPGDAEPRQGPAQVEGGDG